ncbi:ATP-binding cassette domain-containing protein [Streptomyces sp. NPDC048045]|uniref:ABC transporter ATP-binding protein/permease n=1 Tax=Streptomyces sp. NPDC048045 TaxID=3154710 RepID=UPI00341A7147
MALLVGAAAVERPLRSDVRMRSNVPGRQRWSVPALVGRPRLADVLAGALGRIAGIKSVRVNSITGSVLVRHEAKLASADIGAILRTALALVSGNSAWPHRDSTPGEHPAEPPRTAAESTPSQAPAESTPSQTPAQTTPPQTLAPSARKTVHPVLAVTGAVVGAAALALGRGRTKALRRPLLALGAVVAATAVVVRRAVSGAAGPADPRSTASGTAQRPRTSLRSLLDIVGPHKPRLALAAGLSAVCQLAEVVCGLFLGWIALVLIKGSCPPLLALGLTGASAQLWFLAAAAAVACGAVAALSYAANLQWRGLGQAVQHDWRNRTYAHVQRLELGHLEGERTTRVAGVLTDEVAQLGSFLATGAGDVVQLAMSFLVLVPAFLLLAPQIAWIAFLPMPIVAWLSFHYQDRVAADYAVSSEHHAELHSQLVNSLEAGATVKSFCTEDYEAERVDRLGEEFRQSNRRTDRSTVRHAETIRACTTASMVGMLLLGGRSVLDGALPFEVFSPLIGLPQQVLLRLTRLGTVVDQYQRTLTAYERIRHLHALPTEAVGAETPLDAASVQGGITLDGVTFAYPGRPPVLDDFSLQIAPGRITGVVGATGSGKTTIAKLLMRFQDAQLGRVLLDGQDVRDLARRDLRAAVGFVAQDPFLFDGTIADNIRYGSFDATDEQVARAARTAEAHPFITTLPDGYDTTIGERGAALSGGQKQRIALARAILKDSPVVILDEATSAVDNETEAAIQRALRSFAENRTLIVIAHRLSTIRNADWIYVLDKGGIMAEQGTHAELLARDGLYASLWDLQAGRQAA